MCVYRAYNKVNNVCILGLYKAKLSSKVAAEIIKVEPYMYKVKTHILMFLTTRYLLVKPSALKYVCIMHVHIYAQGRRK